MIRKAIRKLRSVARRLPVLLAVLYVRIFIKHRARFRTYSASLLGYKIDFHDPRAFFYEFQFIFGDHIYGFESTRPDPFIIDGGGYIGLSTLYFKRRYPKARVLVFEPDKGILPLLYKNISQNNLSEVGVRESGLYSHEGTVSFSPDLTDGGKIGSGADSIRVEKLSPHICDTVDFLKLNIEGAELEVIRDLDTSNALHFVRELCIEWHSFRGQDQQLAELLALLQKNGFRYYVSSLRGTPRGNFRAQKDMQFYLLVYARNGAPHIHA